MILATQKPSGVVDDQIWSNSRFKIALKVADRSDSNEMLHTPDAAEITQTGRAYLQVGNNEVYELFQSAWSGADYQPEKDDMGIEDHTIYLINELGQYEILNEDLSGLEDADEIKEVPTELDAIVHNIHLLCEEQEIPPVPQPWLPPLKERIALEELEEVQPVIAWAQEKSLSILLGMADIPQAQKQEAVSINLAKDGHVLLYGSPGTGKTTFLQSAGMDLARKFSPKDLTMYLMDFGTNGLAPLSKLPQVADTMSLDQTEKISKFVRIMEKELNRRKKLLADYGVGTLELYRQASGQEEPAIVILLDSYEAFKEEAYEAELFKLLVRISREGLSIGVHLLMTAGRQSNLRAQLYSNFKHQLSLPQNEASEVRTIVGSTSLAMTMEDIKGRALMKREDVDVIQLALPVSGANENQVLNNLRQGVASLQEAWTGRRPSAIPMVPEELTETDFYSREAVLGLLEKGQLPLGLDLENVEPLSWDLSKGNLLYIFEKEWQNDNMIRNILYNLSKLRIDTTLLSVSKFQEQYKFSRVISSELDRKNKIEEVFDLVCENIDLGEILSQPYIVIWDEIEELVQENELLSEKILYILNHGPRIGLYSFITTIPSLSNSLNVVSKFIKQLKYAIVELRLNDQKIINVSNVKYSEPILEKSIAYMVDDKYYQKMKIMKGVDYE